MNHISIRARLRRGLVPLSLSLLGLLLMTSSAWSANLASPTVAPSPAKAGTADQAEAPNAPTCPEGQCFTDVPSTSTFFAYINSLFLDNIISGYPCGGTGEPCDSQNRPYYRPVASVTRGQMAKFVDNGRRNIAEAAGLSLVLTQTAGGSALSVYSGNGSDTAVFSNTDGGAAVRGNCQSTSSPECFAIFGLSQPGSRPAYFEGGKGVGAASYDPNESALSALGEGVNDRGADLNSESYQGANINTQSTSAYSLAVDHPTGGAAALDVNGSVLIVNDLVVGGSKTGYVVDIMQNAGNRPLEAGDVVTIVDTAAPVLGRIPLITVTKASTAYDTGVVGVVDKGVYVPDARTKAAYDAQQEAYRNALDQRNQAEQAAIASGTRPDLSGIHMPQLTITDEQGSIHSLDDVKEITTGSYANVVTLGSYKGVKVDASFGPIRKGDLLVASPNPGYAMKATDRSLASGATIGKALADLESGTAIIPVMVTLK